MDCGIEHFSSLIVAATKSVFCYDLELTGVHVCSLAVVLVQIVGLVRSECAAGVIARDGAGCQWWSGDSTPSGPWFVSGVRGAADLSGAFLRL